ERRGQLRPREELAEMLAGLGVLSLRYDRRGKGRSTGDSRAAFAEHVDDAAAALALLQGKVGEGGRVILIGHSEGALLAAALAARTPSLGGLVLLSAPSKKG